MKLPRRAWLLLIPLLLLLLGVTLAGPLQSWVAEVLGDETRHRIVAFYSRLTARKTETANLVPIAHAGVNPYGINVFLQQEVEEQKIRRTLEMVRAAGFHWVKQQVLWFEIEVPRKGQYYNEKHKVNTWAKYDLIVELCQEYGLQPILRLDTSPAWARPGSSKIETPPDNFDDYGDFVYTVVSRYLGKVKYYQIWNEPNITFEWGDRPVNATEYVRLLRVAYNRAKEADPDCVIISAAPAPTVEMSPQAVNDLVFLQQMYDAGAKDFFDIMSANPYGLRSGPDDHRLNMETDVNFSRPVLVRELMVRNGDASKAIWASEMGWNVLPPVFPEEPVFGRVSRELQAKYTVRGYQRAQEEWPWMGVMNLWHFRMVHEADKQRQTYYFNVVDEEFQPYPVYEAMQDFTNRAPLMHYGYHQESHWALHYGGPWERVDDPQAVLGTYARSDGLGATLKFTFEGTELELVGATGPALGTALVAIDGEPANGLPRYEEGRTYIDQRAAESQWQVRFPLATGLKNELHTVELKVAEGTIAIDGLVVNRPSQNWSLW